MQADTSLSKPRYRSLKLILPLLFLAIALLAVGCNQPLQPGETYHKLTVLWPIFDLEKSEGQLSDGVTWVKEKGDACCWLATWDKHKKYDQKGFLIYRKEKSGFFPIYFTEIEEDEGFRHKKGSVLLWPYESRRDKTGQNTSK